MAYDSSCFTVCEVLAASANNVVLECIARATPILINRHPAVVEYLGLNYPLFYDDPNEIPRLLDDKKIHEAHHYLKNLQTKPWLQVGNFVTDLISFVKQIKIAKPTPIITSSETLRTNLSGSKIVLPKIPSKNSGAPLHIITCRFNPIDYEVPMNNYLRFREMLGTLRDCRRIPNFVNYFKKISKEAIGLKF